MTTVSPTSGLTSGGTVVNITGLGLAGAAAVTFGAVAAVSFVANSAISITATAPPQGPGTVDITVTAITTSATNPSDQFTYIQNITSTPTLREWSMLLLAFLLAAAGYLGLMKTAPRHAA
ncbi:MAG: IPT/TIG domain-containing protein [Bryobacteraceae bacterium]